MVAASGSRRPLHGVRRFESVRSGANSGAILAYGIGSVRAGCGLAVLLQPLRRLGVLPPRRHSTFMRTLLEEATAVSPTTDPARTPAALHFTRRPAS